MAKEPDERYQSVGRRLVAAAKRALDPSSHSSDSTIPSRKQLQVNYIRRKHPHPSMHRINGLLIHHRQRFTPGASG